MIKSSNNFTLLRDSEFVNRFRLLQLLPLQLHLSRLFEDADAELLRLLNLFHLSKRFELESSLHISRCNLELFRFLNLVEPLSPRLIVLLQTLTTFYLNGLVPYHGLFVRNLGDLLPLLIQNRNLLKSQDMRNGKLVVVS